MENWGSKVSFHWDNTTEITEWTSYDGKKALNINVVIVPGLMFEFMKEFR